MDLLGVVLAIAQDVLANVITDFFARRRTSANDEELERRVIEIIEQKYQVVPADQIQEVIRRSLSEIGVLAEDFPYITSTGGEIRPRLPEPVGLFGDEEAQDHVGYRLRKLAQIVEARRRELGIIDEDQQSDVDSTRPTGSSAWSIKLHELGRNIREQRIVNDLRRHSF